MGKKENTRKMMANSLLELAKTKPVDKITIREIFAYWAQEGMKISSEEMADHILAAMPQTLMKLM